MSTDGDRATERERDPTFSTCRRLTRAVRLGVLLACVVRRIDSREVQKDMCMYEAKHERNAEPGDERRDWKEGKNGSFPSQERKREKKASLLVRKRRKAGEKEEDLRKKRGMETRIEDFRLSSALFVHLCGQGDEVDDPR